MHWKQENVNNLYSSLAIAILYRKLKGQFKTLTVAVFIASTRQPPQPGVVHCSHPQPAVVHCTGPQPEEVHCSGPQPDKEVRCSRPQPVPCSKPQITAGAA